MMDEIELAHMAAELADTVPAKGACLITAPGKVWVLEGGSGERHRPQRRRDLTHRRHS